MSATVPPSARFPLPASALLLAGLLLLGCGSRPATTPRSTGGTNGSGGATMMGTGGTGAGGRAPDGMNVGGANVGGSAGTTPAGTGGAAPAVAPPGVDISGRWGMFGFEDPVGVQLVQAPDGTLTGRGCVAGAPGSSRSNVPLAFPEWCGDVTGEVRGRSASFGFTLRALGDGTHYATRVAVSEDARRMTGTFSTAVSNPVAPVGWLPVPDDSNSLPYKGGTFEHSSAFGAYQLVVVPGESLGNEFVAGRTYLLVYDRDYIRGDLGMFWQSEVSTAGGAIRVGPVPATTPELPISISLELAGDAISRVTATTASGGRYTFTATFTAPRGP